MEDEQMIKVFKNMERKSQQAIAELIDGSIMGHHFYVSKIKNSKAVPEDSLVTYLFANSVGLKEKLAEIYEAKEEGIIGIRCRFDDKKIDLKVPVTENVHDFIK